MAYSETEEHSRVVKIGWGLLMLASGLFLLLGVSWFFSGPDNVVALLADRLGTTAADLEASFPEAVFGEAREARWAAIYLTSIGAMSFLAAFNGYRRGTRLAWHITWVLIFTIAAVIANGLVGSEEPIGGFVLGLLIVLVIAVGGQLMARPGRGADL